MGTFSGLDMCNKNASQPFNFSAIFSDCSQISIISSNNIATERQGCSLDAVRANVSDMCSKISAYQQTIQANSDRIQSLIKEYISDSEEIDVDVVFQNLSILATETPDLIAISESDFKGFIKNYAALSGDDKYSALSSDDIRFLGVDSKVRQNTLVSVGFCAGKGELGQLGQKSRLAWRGRNPQCLAIAQAGNLFPESEKCSKHSAKQEER
jgi:hypothetical protein